MWRVCVWVEGACVEGVCVGGGCACVECVCVCGGCVGGGMSTAKYTHNYAVRINAIQIQ